MILDYPTKETQPEINCLLYIFIDACTKVQLFTLLCSNLTFNVILYL